MIVTRVIEDGKDFCMDDLINIFAKGEGESAILTWVTNGIEQTEKCYYLDNNSSEVSVFYVKRNDRKFDKAFVTIDIKQIIEVNYVRLSIIKKSVEKVIKEELESEMIKKTITTFVQKWNWWVSEWSAVTGKRGGHVFMNNAKWIMIAELNGYDPDFVMDVTGCNLRNWMEWREKIINIMKFLVGRKNGKTHNEIEIIEYINSKFNYNIKKCTITDKSDYFDK